MQGQGSLGVNKYTSENNEQLLQQLDPQEVGSLAKKLTQDKRRRGKLLARTLTKRFEMMFPEGQLRTVSERAGFVRTVSKKCTAQIVKMWTMDW